MTGLGNAINAPWKVQKIACLGITGAMSSIHAVGIILEVKCIVQTVSVTIRADKILSVGISTRETARANVRKPRRRTSHWCLDASRKSSGTTDIGIGKEGELDGIAVSLRSYPVTIKAKVITVMNCA